MRIWPAYSVQPFEISSPETAILFDWCRELNESLLKSTFALDFVLSIAELGEDPEP